MIRLFLRVPVLFISLALSVDNAFSADVSKVGDAEPTVVAPGGLTERESAALQKQYEFQVRRKDRLLTPYFAPTATAGAAIPARAPAAAGEWPEEEKLYRYFGVAADLYKQGRLEESMEIFRYLREQYPDDDYIRSYYERVEKELKGQRSTWKKDGQREAAELKRIKIENLVRDGVDYYEAGEYGKSLVRFSDALALDPNNATAKSYMPKLKSYYSREIRAETIMRQWEEEKATGRPSARPAAAEPAEAAAPSIASNVSPRYQRAPADMKGASAETMLAREEMRNIVIDKKAEQLLEEVEFGSRVDAIIAQQKLAEGGGQLRLGAGDMVKITVLNHPELSGDVVLKAAGEINLPLSGDMIMAGNLTTDELSQKVKTVLEKYVQNPYVTITLMSYRSQIFYLIDDVSCTPYPITNPNLTLRDALFLSDWGDNKALGRVIVMKPSKTHPIIRKVDAYDLIFRGNLKNNIPIGNGDVIYIPMTIAAKTTKTIYDSLAPFRAVRALKDEWLSQKWSRTGWENYWVVPHDQAESNYKDQNWVPNVGGGSGGGGY